jgi:mutator protein MutT
MIEPGSGAIKSFEIRQNSEYLVGMQQVAVGIIMKDGQVLACQRKRTARYPLKWEFPGGKMEAGESAPQALVRELREELGIEAVVGKEFLRQEWTYPASAQDRGSDGTFKVFYFLVDGFTGDAVNKAFEQIRWVSPLELESMDILEGNRQAVALLVRHAREQQAA